MNPTPKIQKGKKEKVSQVQMEKLPPKRKHPRNQVSALINKYSSLKIKPSIADTFVLHTFESLRAPNLAHSFYDIL